MHSRDELDDMVTAWKGATGTAGSQTGTRFIVGDDMLGALFQYLKDLEIYDETYIVITNDHGQEAKGTVYLSSMCAVHLYSLSAMFQANCTCKALAF